MRFLSFRTPSLPGMAFLCLLLLTSSSVLYADPVTSLFAAADSASPRLADARAELAEAEAAYRSARAMPNPVLFGSRETLGANGEEEVERTIGIRQPLGYLWSYAPRLASARSAFAAAHAAFAEEQRLLHVELIRVTLRAGALRKQTELVDTVLVHAAAAVKAMENRFALGDVAEYDLHRLQAELMRIRSQKLSLLAEWNSTALDFSELSGLPEERLETIEVPASSAPGFSSLDSLLKWAGDHRALLTAARETRASAGDAYSASRWNQLPEIEIGIGRKSADPDFTGVAIEAEIELPLFHQRRADRALAKTALDRTALREQAAMRRVRQEVKAAWRQWTELNLPADGMPVFSVEQARSDLERGVRIYLQGEFSPVELVDVLRSTVESLEVYLELQNARIIAALELRRVSGLPLWEQQ